jgi:hypothetical protein
VKVYPSDNNPTLFNPIYSIEEENFEQLTKIDEEIQKITTKFFYNFGFGKKKINDLLLKHITFLSTLSTSENTDTLNSVISISNDKSYYLSGELKTYYQLIAISSEKRKKEILTTKVSIPIKKTQQTVVNTTTPQKPDDLTITSNNISINQPFNKRILTFSKSHKTEPYFRFTLKIGTRKLNLKGIGIDRDGHVKASGSFGRIFFGTDQDGEKVAVKVATPPPEGMPALKREGHFLHQMNDCPNVIGASEIGYMDEDSPMMFAVMNHIEGKELFEELQNISNPMQAKEKAKVLQDVISALQNLHNKEIIHRDLKTENILVNRSSGKTYLLDLGLSRTVKSKPSGLQGSAEYLSPETLLKKVQDIQSDTYAFGIMVHEMFSCGEILANPKQGSNLRLQDDIKVFAYKYPRSIPQQAKIKIANLVNSCLKYNTSERISDEEIIKKLEEIQIDLS